MSFLSLELNDAGIMAAGGSPPRLLAVDGETCESPGYALPEKKRLTLGKAAESQAHFYPHLIQNRFWDQLNTEPLKKAGKSAINHAEIAYAQLAMIWEGIKPHGTEVMVTVPGFLNTYQLGIFLGIAQELAMPVRGFVTQSVAAVPSPLPGNALIYLNIHLHRTEAALLSQKERLREEDILTMDERGLIHLHRTWVESMAAEFVRTTRFDPLHDAAWEQELFDRLPGVLTDLRDNSTVSFDLRSDHTVHNITVTRELFAKKAALYFDSVKKMIHSLLQDRDAGQAPLTLLLTHRFSQLPGVRTFLAGLGHPRTVELEPGASALNVLRNLDQFGGQAHGRDTDYFTSRPWQPFVPTTATGDAAASPKAPHRPTHLLHRNLAYPITKTPMFIGGKEPLATGTFQIGGELEKDVHRYCAFQQKGNRVVLTVLHRGNTFVDNEPVGTDTVLSLGQTIRVGESGDAIRLIACLENHET